MIDWLLNQMPEMLARYEYMHSLLDWLQEWINELKIEKPAFPWVLPSPLLITSLERAAQECRAVNILRFLVEVQKQIDELKKVNEQRGNDTLALQALMNLSDNVPRLERRFKKRACEIWSNGAAFLCCVIISALGNWVVRMDSNSKGMVWQMTTCLSSWSPQQNESVPSLF